MAGVLYEKRDRIATITLNRPEAMNAYTPEMVVELARIWEDFAEDPDVWVAIVTGAGDKAFCAGHDIKALLAGETTQYDDPAPTLWYGDIEVYKPIVAAVNGYALGGGCSLALACDLRVAAESAVFGYPQVKYGAMSLGGHQRLPRTIFPAIAMEMILTGETIDAREAHRVGLVNRVVPRAELMAEARKMAERICRNAPLSVRASKEAFLRGQRVPLREGIRMAKAISFKLQTSEDTKEGLRAFREKREPRWQGR